MDDAGMDRFLLELAAGEPRAYARLYDDFAERLYRAALGMLGRSEEAEDAVQEVFASLVQSRERLPQVRNLTAYLFTSLRREAGRRAARRAREPAARQNVADQLAECPDRQPPGNENPYTEALGRALGALPDEQREVVALKINGELTFAEIGLLLNISPNTAASRYRYALEKLRSMLEGE
jgi:RNA polymerase sigma-70 factor (ECF subfamily)